MTDKNDTQRQFVRSRKGADNSGVASAEPRVITGDEDATFTTHPERHKPHSKKYS